MNSTEEYEEDWLPVGAGIIRFLDVTCLGMTLLIAFMMFIEPENPWIWLPIIILMMAMGLHIVLRAIAEQL